MSKLVPRLVKDEETGEVCIQVSEGSLTATLPLPGPWAEWDEVRKSIFLEAVVPEMISGLLEKKRAEMKKLHRKVLKKK